MLEIHVLMMFLIKWFLEFNLASDGFIPELSSSNFWLLFVRLPTLCNELYLI